MFLRFLVQNHLTLEYIPNFNFEGLTNIFQLNFSYRRNMYNLLFTFLIDFRSTIFFKELCRPHVFLKIEMIKKKKGQKRKGGKEFTIEK